jgi:hypothetical protein
MISYIGLLSDDISNIRLAFVSYGMFTKGEFFCLNIAVVDRDGKNLQFVRRYMPCMMCHT